MAALPAIAPETNVENPNTAIEPDAPESRYGENNRDLPDQLKRAITSAIRAAQNEEKYLRRLEVLHDRKLRFYERGHQHIYETNDGFALAIPGGTFDTPDGNTEEWGDYIDDYPLFHGFIWIIQSVLTQNGPGIAFQPLNPQQSEDNQAAETADGLRKHFDRVNDVKKIMRQIVRMFCLSGRTATWVKTEANAARWGRDDAGNPRRNQTVEVAGCLETRCPIMEREQSNFRYFIWMRDLDVYNARQNHSWISKKVKANESFLDENNYERFARLGVLQGARSQFQAGEAISHMVTEGHAWLRPSCFSGEEFDKPFDEADGSDWVQDEGGMRPPTIREALASAFADRDGGFTGIHAVYVGQTYSEAWAESMDDVLIVEQPFVGDGQYGIAIMDPAVVAQDRFNTLMNYIAETFDFGAPSTWVAASKVDYESYLAQNAQPYSIRQLKALAGNTTAVADNFYREPNPEIPATLADVIQFLMGEFLQFVLACPPAMWGESSSDTKTASGLAQSRNQALGRMGILWAALQKIMARMYQQIALAASNDPQTPEEIIVPVEGSQNVTVRIERLRKGHFMCFPDEDSGFPDSTAAKRATMMTVLELVTQFPMVAEQFFSVPGNVKETCRLMGMSEIVFPEAESYDKQTLEIEELLNGVPSEPTPEEIALGEQEHMAKFQAESEANAMMGVATPPPTPFDPQSLKRSSVPIKPWDHDEWEMNACDAYLNSEAARTELKVGRPDPLTGEMVPNVRGIENVWLHRQEHAEALALKMPMEPPPMPVTAPKGGGAKGGQPKNPMQGQPGAPPMPESGAAGAPGTATI